ncbi:MAG: hypothetical protein L0287_14105 [Anaerolineae bacterium]|nr:hypothetical protein [Anaerolineae bacterium]
MSIHEIEQAITELSPNELIASASGLKSLMLRLGMNSSSAMPNPESWTNSPKRRLGISVQAMPKSYETFCQPSILGKI